MWQQDPWSNGSAQGLISATSADGGHLWREGPVPFGNCTDKHSSIRRVGDLGLTVGLDGTAYVAASGTTRQRLQSFSQADTENTPDMVLVATSRGNRGRWSARAVFQASQGVWDVSIVADAVRPETAYLSWTSSDGIWFTRTDSGGETWTRQARIVTPDAGPVAGVGGGRIVVSPRAGTLYLVYARSQPAERPRRWCGRIGGHKRCFTVGDVSGLPPSVSDIMLLSSRDGGTTWSAPRHVADDFSVHRIAPHDLGIMRTASHLPQAAVDPRSGALYVVWQDARFSIGRFDEIAIASSRDGGLHWAAARRVNVPGQGAAIVPSIAAGSGGLVGVTYYQLKGTVMRRGGLPADYWFRSMSSSGRLATPRRLAGQFDLAHTPTDMGHFVGAYQGLVATDRSFYAMFVVPSRGKSTATGIFATAVRP